MSDDLPKGLIRSPSDGRVRCNWHDDKADYRTYHDVEWGRPEDDDVKLFEKICLEGFQSGLSWLTILRKRENFRAAFSGFDFYTVAKFDDADIERLLEDKGIVRHGGKIRSTINNAARAIEMVEAEGSLGAFFWSYAPKDRPDVIDADVAYTPHVPESAALSKELKARGWSFVGPTTCYAFMQAMGMVNDHIEGCAFREEVEAEQRAFTVPGR